MAHLHIHRTHQLGLEGAQALLQEWVTSAQTQWGLTCTPSADDTMTSVRFSRAGFSGDVRVSAHDVALTAELGFLLSPYAARIEAGIHEQLDRQLRQAAAGDPPCPSAP